MEFPTTKEWQTIELPLADFEPVWRGRPVSGAGPVISEKIRQIGFLLADGRQAQFRLDFGAIESLN
jgi:hypothetical protein